MVGESDAKELYEVFDINWSFDGTMIAAGLDKSVVILDMSKILANPAETFLTPQHSQSSILHLKNNQIGSQKPIGSQHSVVNI